jgi:protein ImuB
LCEIARERAMIESPFGPGGMRPSGPIGVVLIDEGDALRDEAPTATLDAVEDEARRFGVRPGMQVVEAAALVSRLMIVRVTRTAVEAALGRVAEVAQGLGPIAAIQLGKGQDITPSSDTVWLDVTGASHLAGGEEALAAELIERVHQLGHRAEVAISSGARIAQAVARWSNNAATIVAPGSEKQALAPLPVQALGLDEASAAFFIRVGVFTIGDLAKLPRASVRGRVTAKTSSSAAAIAMDLLDARDDAPLVPYEAPRVLEEDVRFEEGVEGTEPLVFVMRAMVSRLSARLSARGEACHRIEGVIAVDRSIERLRSAPDTEPVGEVLFFVDLPAALSSSNDLLRALKAKVDRVALPAPAIGVRLVIPQIARRPRVQLDLGRDRGHDPDALPALLAELSAEIGPEHVGVLVEVDDHRPERRSRLAPVDLKRTHEKAASDDVSEQREPTRLFVEPVPIGRVARGAVIAFERKLYTVARLDFTMRLGDIGWWTPSPVSRDYARVLLVPGEGAGSTENISLVGNNRGRKQPASGPVVDALVYVDRGTGEAFLQGLFE